VGNSLDKFVRNSKRGRFGEGLNVIPLLSSQPLRDGNPLLVRLSAGRSGADHQYSGFLMEPRPTARTARDLAGNPSTTNEERRLDSTLSGALKFSTQP
jgi:hypothetical protein